MDGQLSFETAEHISYPAATNKQGAAAAAAAAGAPSCLDNTTAKEGGDLITLATTMAESIPDSAGPCVVWPRALLLLLDAALAYLRA